MLLVLVAWVSVAMATTLEGVEGRLSVAVSTDALASSCTTRYFFRPESDLLRSYELHFSETASVPEYSQRGFLWGEVNQKDDVVEEAVFRPSDRLRAVGTGPFATLPVRRPTIVVIVREPGLTNAATVDEARYYLWQQEYHVNAWFAAVTRGGVFFNNTVRNSVDYDIIDLTIATNPTSPSQYVTEALMALPSFGYSISSYTQLVMLLGKNASDVNPAISYGIGTIGCIPSDISGCWTMGVDHMNP